MTPPRVDALLLAHRTLHDLSDSALLDCQLLLAHCLDVPRTWLLSHPEAIVCERAEAHYKKLLQRRLDGEPVAYLLGYRDFWNRRFEVTSDTLVPRPETELLVETALDRFPNEAMMVADFGTGSGAIAVTLADERPRWSVFGIDNNYATLEVASRNSSGLENISFIQANWGDALKTASLDLIVSNPPYIAPGDPYLESLGAEPAAALVSGEDGLRDIKKISRTAMTILKPGGSLLMEHGFSQRADVEAQLSSAGFSCEVLDDLAGLPRAILATLPGTKPGSQS